MLNLEELVDSINKIGLLQPMVVRCHVVELEDKIALEVSIIENAQIHALNPKEKV